jgi:hypothetical protein
MQVLVGLVVRPEDAQYESRQLRCAPTNSRAENFILRSDTSVCLFPAHAHLRGPLPEQASSERPVDSAWAKNAQQPRKTTNIDINEESRQIFYLTTGKDLPL